MAEDLDDRAGLTADSTDFLEPGHPELFDDGLEEPGELDDGGLDVLDSDPDDELDPDLDDLTYVETEEEED